MKKLFIFPLLLIACAAKAQIAQLHPAGDSSKTVSLEGYADVYFAFDFNHPRDFNRPYFVSHHRHNETNINLAYLSLKYTSARARATFTPGFGTYMNANYAAELVTLRNIVEANVGVKLARNKDIWLDAGVLSAPYTTETALAFDQLLYTRSFAAEYSPYYLTGARLTLPLSKKTKLYLYIINGWQVIEDVNQPLSFASQLELKPNAKWLIDWSTYIGGEQSANTPDYRGRWFTDLFFVYTPNPKWTVSLDAYAGRQKKEDSLGRRPSATWGQANLNLRYALNSTTSISARAERFRDRQSVFIVPVTGIAGFDCTSYSLCLTRSVNENVMLRLEGRWFQSPRDIFYRKNGAPSGTDALVTGGLVAKF